MNMSLIELHYLYSMISGFICQAVFTEVFYEQKTFSDLDSYHWNINTNLNQENKTIPEFCF